MPGLRTWSLVHTWSSLICTAALILLCLTGLPLIFRDEIKALAGTDVAAPPMPDGTPAASLARVVDAAQRRYPREFVRFFYWDDDHPHVIRVALLPTADADTDQRRMVAVDARTAQVLAEPTPDRGFMYVMRTLHEELFAGLAGELFLCVMGLLFVASVVSGTVVYGPFMRKLEFGTIRRHRAGRLQWLDLHNLLGIVTVAWALVVGATGVMNTLATPLFGLWQRQELPGLLAPHQGKPAPAQLSSVDAAVETAARALPDAKLLSVLFPNTSFGSPRHYLVWTKGRTPLTSRLLTPVLVDAETGALTRASGLPWYLRALQVSRPLHFGDYGGLPLKLVWALLDVVTIVVLGSGVYLWLARRRTPLALRIEELERSSVEPAATAR